MLRLAFAAVLGLNAYATAQIQDPPEVREVAIRGLDRISEQLVRSQLEMKPGQPLSPLAVARDVRRLYALGYFSYIEVDEEEVAGGVVITYIVIEKLYIDDVRIIGNRKIKDREIRAQISWKEGDSFVEEGYEEERDAVLHLYRQKGFPNPVVDIVVERLSSSRVRVSYIIDEGRRARIKDISFNGNTVLSDKALRKLFKTKRGRWFLGGRYDEQRFEDDLGVLLDKMADYGRLEADILTTNFRYGNKGKKLFITIDLAEGPEYTVETLDIVDNIVFDDDELLTSIKVQAGDVHNLTQMEEDARAIETGYSDFGYIDARVEPRYTLNRDRQTTNIAHRILEGELKYVREIKITGNDVTRDDVIRRQILLGPGDRFDGALLRASQNQLEATQFFEGPPNGPRLFPERIEDDERFQNLLVDVTEGQTGNFNFGGGFSTTEGLGGFVEFRLRNFDITNWPSFSGGGQQFAASLSLGDVRSEFSVSFTDPEFLGYPFSFGVDLFNQSFRTTGGSNFTEETQGGMIRLGKALSPFVTLRTSLRVTDVDISDFRRFNLFELFVTPELRELNDPGTTVSNTWSITRNTLDHFRDPTRGSVHSFSVEVAGLADNDFVKIQLDSRWYYSFDRDKKFVLSYRSRQGAAWATGDKELVPIGDRFFAGGTSTIRGYDNRDVGPKVRPFRFFGEKQAIGGELRLLNTVELKYKTNDLLRLYVFADSGGVWKTVDDLDFGDVKYSVGIGLGIDVPAMGPMRLDYGFPLNADDDQGSGRLHLQTGFRF